MKPSGNIGLNDLLRRRIVAAEPGLVTQVAVGVVVGAVAVGVRWSGMSLLGLVSPFVSFFPAVMAVGAFVGVRAGVACLLTCALAGSVLFFPPMGLMSPDPRVLIPETVFLVSGAFMLWLVAMLRSTARALYASDSQQRLLSQELQHRVKNTLAIVQSLADQTLRSGDDPVAIKRDFTDRLIALANAHNVLSDASWTDVTLRGLTERALAPFQGAGAGRFVIEGEDVALAPDHVVSLTLCLHELATNATKYGALSAPGGRVQIGWDLRRIAGRRRCRLEWMELGGPPVTAPTRKGFGSRLLSRGLSGRSRPQITLQFPPGGLRWRAEFDLDGEA